MELQPLVDQIAKAVAFVDDSDAAGLEALRHQLLELKAAAEECGLPGLSESCDLGIEAVGELMGEPELPGPWVATLGEIAGYAAQVMDALDLELPPESVPLPMPAGQEEAPAEASKADLDPDLIEMFVGSSGDNVNDLEECFLAMETSKSVEDQEEYFGQIKRSLHTIKGECGVIPLPEAQRLCHEAEDLFGRFAEAHAPLPIQLLLELTDWLGAYVAQLAGGDWSAVPEHAELLAKLTACEPAPEVDDSPLFEDVPEEDEEVPAGAEAPEDNIEDDGTRITFPDEILEDEVLPDFITEAREHIDASEAALLDLENSPEDIELINAIFRAFHTIKGVAGYLNLEPMVKLAHTAETLMDQLRRGEAVCGKTHLDLIFASCDIMNALVGALEGGQGPTLAAHAKLVAGLEAEINGEPAVAPPVERAELVTEVLGEVGVDSAEALLTDPEQPQAVWRKLGEILIDQGLISPKIAEVMLERQKTIKGKPLGQMLVDTGLLTSADIDAALEIQARERETALGGEGAPSEPPSPAPEAAPEVSKVPEAPAKEPKAPAAPEPKPAAAPTEEAAPAAHAEAKQQPASAAGTDRGALTPTPAPKKAPAAPARKPRIASTIKVNTGRLDSLVDLVGELVIAQQMIYQDPDLEDLASERLTRNLAQVAKITRDMHEAAMSLRMITLKPTFQKMARLVRDVSAKAGKQVELVLNGEDTELDRNVVEEISDPMVHLIRNAIDHGLETPEVRAANGKQPTGRLELRAFHQGGSIVIEIIDDGAGLSRERILAKAMEKGLLAPDVEPDELPDAQVWDLIFQPGFSTAAVVSDISGRGVGMDVVRRNIEKMRGKVEIVSKEGEGSVFSLRLPLTLAIIDGMIVRVGAQRYVLPTLSIEQSFRPSDEQLHSVMNQGELVKVRDLLLPIHPVRDLFDQEDGIQDVRQGILIVLEDNGQRCCLMVDEILGQQQVVIKGLGEAGSVLRGISGGAILGDGRIALIVDVDGLVTRTSQAVA